MKKNTRNLLLVLGLVVILGAAVLVLVLTGGQEEGESSSTSSTELISLISEEEKNLSSVKVTNENGSYIIKITEQEKESSSSSEESGSSSEAEPEMEYIYSIDGVDETVANTDRMETAAAIGLSLNATRNLGKQEKLDDFGLAEPVSTVEVTYRDGSTKTVYIYINRFGGTIPIGYLHSRNGLCQAKVIQLLLFPQIPGSIQRKTYSRSRFHTIGIRHRFINAVYGIDILHLRLRFRRRARFLRRGGTFLLLLRYLNDIGTIFIGHFHRREILFLFRYKGDQLCGRGRGGFTLLLPTCKDQNQDGRPQNHDQPEDQQQISGILFHLQVPPLEEDHHADHKEDNRDADHECVETPALSFRLAHSDILRIEFDSIAGYRCCGAGGVGQILKEIDGIILIREGRSVEEATVYKEAAAHSHHIGIPVGIAGVLIHLRSHSDQIFLTGGNRLHFLALCVVY